jgi:hypothetical protein
MLGAWGIGVLGVSGVGILGDSGGGLGACGGKPMIGLLALMLLRPLLAPLARLGTGFLVATILAVGAELLAERFVDPDLPRWVALTLALAMAAAWRFLVRRWLQFRIAVTVASELGGARSPSAATQERGASAAPSSSQDGEYL